MKKNIVTLAALASATLLFAGCSSQADTVDRNISVDAEKFNVQRSIKGINAITDTPAFEVEGRCSIETEGDILHAICKHDENDYRRHTLSASDNVYWASVQLDPIDVSEFRTKIVIKPESIIPEFDLETSGDIEGDG